MIQFALRGFILVVLSGVGGCFYNKQQSFGQLPSVPDNTSLPAMERPYEILGWGEAETSNFNFFWSWGVTGPPNPDRAIAKIVSQKGGDALVNIQLEERREYWAVGTINILKIRGQVIRYRSFGEVAENGNP